MTDTRRILKRDEIVDRLRTVRYYLSHQYGVRRIGLFGSYARGDNRADSDIDFFVELSEPRYDWMAGLQIYLEGLFGQRIGLIRDNNALSQRLRSRIEKELIDA
jgi:predicted nucleotidyltransferase